MSADMLRCKIKSIRQITLSWSLHTYLSEGWEYLFLRYKTYLHKSTSESSQEGTDKAQKVYVRANFIFQASLFLPVVYGILRSFSLEEQSSLCSSDKYFLSNQKCPSKSSHIPNSNSSWFCSWEVGGVPGERIWVPGLMSEGRRQWRPWEWSHDLHYILAAAEVGGHWTLVSREFGITLWSLKWSLP